LPTSSASDAFAKDPPAYLPVPADATVVDDPRFFLIVSADGAWATACRLDGDATEIFATVNAHAPSARIVWITDGTQEPELRALGCRDQDPPLSSYITALAAETEPPAVAGVEVRRLESDEDAAVARRVSERGWGTPLRTTEPNGWLAYVDGAPVAYAEAITGPLGLLLSGGVTVPEARGRGAYRALVRARWDEAVRLGTPLLVVHAEEASRRVLERIGFRRVSPIVELVSC
jgi:GNAT superfamily N-acetyltransferase